MNQCPYPHNAGAKLRPELPPLTPRLARLPVDERGYPVPFFVSWIDGKPDFRIADSEKLMRCLKGGLCWVCGEALGRWKSFVIGPMCTVNRISADPATHRDCAEWSVKACPFLTKPKMVRREDELTKANKENVAGVMIERNPGVMAVWTCNTFRVLREPKGYLFSLGEPDSVSWWREGRPATRAEVIEGLETGLPTLQAMCDVPAAVKALERAVLAAFKYVPREPRLLEMERGKITNQERIPA